MATKKTTGELNDDEKLLYEGIQKAATGEVMRLLNDGQVRVDCLDAHGMSPLQHASYRGQRELCEALLDRGADVNCNEHEHGYTALMFAALSGNVAVTELLLAAGASPSAVNAVGRNAAQMAAFVGNHRCVSVINNFVPLSELEYYTEARGLEKEGKLTRTLVRPLHRLVSRPNVHPVATVLFVQDNAPLLLDAVPRLVTVLRLLCEREVKRSEANEVLALKYHFLAHTLNACTSHTDGGLDGLVRRWLRAGVETLELFVREGIRQFPFPQCPIIQQLVRTVAAPGGEASALDLVTATVCGQRPTHDGDGKCDACGTISDNCKRCAACKAVHYCGQRCQKLHWVVHKRQCQRQRHEDEAAEPSSEN